MECFEWLPERFTILACEKNARARTRIRWHCFGTLSMGSLGICSLYRPGWIVPAAQVGGLYYGLAALLHVFRKGKNAMERAAMISDTSAFLVLLVVVVRGWA